MLGTAHAASSGLLCDAVRVIGKEEARDATVTGPRGFPPVLCRAGGEVELRLVGRGGGVVVKRERRAVAGGGQELGARGVYTDLGQRSSERVAHGGGGGGAEQVRVAVPGLVCCSLVDGRD